MDQGNLASLLSAAGSALLIVALGYGFWVDAGARREARATDQPYEWPKPAEEPDPPKVPRLTIVLAALSGLFLVASLVARVA